MVCHIYMHVVQICMVDTRPWMLYYGNIVDFHSPASSERAHPYHPCMVYFPAFG